MQPVNWELRSGELHTVWLCFITALYGVERTFLRKVLIRLVSEAA